MKKSLLLGTLYLLFCNDCKAQQRPVEHFTLSRYIPIVYYIGDNVKKIPAGYEIAIHEIYDKRYFFLRGMHNDSWTFLNSNHEGTIGIQTPFVPYDSTRKTILRITDTTKTVCRIVPYDSIWYRMPEFVLYDEKLKVEPFLRRKRKRENMIITNDSLTIYLINIRPKHLDAVRKKVTTPVDMN